MNNYDEEKKEYSDKLQRQISTLDNILDIESCGLIDSTLRDRLSELKDKAKFLKNKLDKNEFEIAIVGLEKAGKSTFANALMGNDILPSDEARCTYTSTRICSGDDTATVKFFTTNEFNSRFKQQLKSMKIPNADSYNYESLSLFSYDSLFDKLDPETKQLHQSSTNEDVRMCLEFKDNLKQFIGSGDKFFSGDQLASEDLKKFIAKPQYALAVKGISIYSSRLENMPNAVIFDVPGFDSPTQIHKEQTVEQMRNADAIILIASAYKPSFTAPIVDLFQKNTDYDGIKFGAKMFVFANKADIAQKLEENMGHIKNDLQRFNIMSPANFDRIVYGSAQAFLEKEGKLNSDVAKDALEKKGVADGINEIQKLLSNYNETERFEILKQRINKIQNDIAEEFKKLSEQYSDDSPASNIFKEGGALFLELQARNAKIIESLEEYRGQINVDYTESTPISQKIKEDVIESISKDNFNVSDDDYNKAKLKNSSVGTNLAPEKINEHIREAKRQEVYMKFTKGIVDLASQNHKECDEEIVKRFLDALEIPQSNANYEKVKENVTKFIDDSKDAYDGVGYYRSLVERFSIDLFDILLLYRLGSDDRWNKYEHDKRNFQALAMFDNNRKQDESIANQPLYFKLLFQREQMLGNYNSQSKIASLLDDLVPMVLDFVPGGSVTKMIGKAVLDPKAWNLVENFIKNNKNKKFKYADVERIFKGYTDKLPNDGGLNYDSYKHYFADLPNADEAIVREQIETDFEILHSVLDSVLINAINIEKAFLALEVGNINNIIKGIQGSRYSEFVRQNASLIKSAEFSNLEAEQQMRLTRKSILNEIKTMLDEMNDGNYDNN